VEKQQIPILWYHGIIINEVESLTSLYADDTFLILDGSGNYILPSYGTAGSMVPRVLWYRGIYFVCSYALQRHPPFFLFIYS